MLADSLPRELRRYRAWALAQAIPVGVRDERFLELVQRIEGGAYHRAPPITLLVDGEAAFTAMLQGIAEAREEVLLETYILRDDRIGVQVQQALIAAVQRGVRVSVLADAIGSFFTRTTFWDALEEHGVLVRHFHRFWHLPFEALRRDHRKIIVIDRAIAFTGGMNIGEEYGSSIRSHAGAWRDTFLRVEGSVAQELAAVFAEGWDRAQGPPLPGLGYVSWSEGITVPPATTVRAFTAQALRARLDRRLALRRDRIRGRRVQRRHEIAIESDRAVLVLDSRPGRGQREMLAVLSALLGGARERLWITTPYFAPPTRALTLLRQAAERGVDVRLLLPGTLADVPLARRAAHGTYSALLASGVRIFEYQAATLHAKTVVIDGRASVVGSSNLDFRSFWLNAECNLLVFDDDLAGALERSFRTDVRDSREIMAAEWSRRGWTARLIDRLARALRWAL